MIPYYLLEVIKFDLSQTNYMIPSQTCLDSVKDDIPTVTYKEVDNQLIEGFLKFNLNCEFFHNKKGRAYGRNDIFESFILIEEKLFYYCERSQLILVSSKKEVFKTFYKYFSQKSPDIPLNVRKLNVNFEFIVSNQLSLGVEGIWLGDYPDINIEAMYLVGNKIETSSQYKEILSKGAKVTNVTILYKYNNKTEKIMITREGGIILYRQVPETEALIFLEDVYHNIFLQFSKFEN